jgi:hypothetical protein
LKILDTPGSYPSIFFNLIGGTISQLGIIFVKHAEIQMIRHDQFKSEKEKGNVKLQNVTESVSAQRPSYFLPSIINLMAEIVLLHIKDLEP